MTPFLSLGKEDAWQPAVSEVVGSLILVSIVVVGMTIGATLLLSSPLPSKLPHFNAIISNQSNNLYILHRGGDALSSGEYQIFVDGVDRTSLFVNNGDDPWSVGETLYATLPDMPGSVALVLNQSGGGSIMLFGKTLEGVKKIPDPSSVEWYNFSSSGGRCDWAYRKSITIHGSQVAGSLTDFPVLVSLASDPELAASARADGKGIVFTAADGTTKLSHEVESFTKATGTLVAWVKVPSLTAGQDTLLWMYYGNVGTDDQQDVANTWSANYNAVWHLKETGAGAANEYKDSAGTNHGQGGGGTAAQVPTRALGLMSYGQDFDATNDNIPAGSGAGVDDIFAAGGTVSAWIYPTGIGENSEGRVADKSNSNVNGGGGWGFATYTNNVMTFRKGFGTTHGAWRTPAGSITLNAWNHVAVTYTHGVGNDPVIYINGVSQAITEFSTPVGLVQSDAARTMTIGNLAGAQSRTFDGIIDEVRASKTIRTPQWIQTEYTNQHDPGSFLSTGGEEEWWKC